LVRNQHGFSFRLRWQGFWLA